MNYFSKIGKDEAIKKLAEHEARGTLLEFIKEVAPEFICDNEVQKFSLLKKLVLL